MLREELLRKLVCPICKAALSEKEEKLKCRECDKEYPVIDGIPNLLPPELLNQSAEEETQDLGAEQHFYEHMFSNLADLEDGHCLVYGYDTIYDFMKDVPRGTLLDVGCGAGHHSKDLVELGFEVTGVDISAKGLVQAKKVAAANQKQVDFVLGDSQHLPFADRAFDVVFCSLILHHFPQNHGILRELSRVSQSFFVGFEVNSYDPVSYVRFNILNPLFGIRNMSKNQRTTDPLKLKMDLQKLGYDKCELKYVDLHHHIGREPQGRTAKLLRCYQTLTSLLPVKYRGNKFLLKCQRTSAGKN